MRHFRISPLFTELRRVSVPGRSYPVSCINPVPMRHNPSLDPRYKNRSRLLAMRLDGYTGSWMRSHPDDEATLNLLAASRRKCGSGSQPKKVTLTSELI